MGDNPFLANTIARLLESGRMSEVRRGLPEEPGGATCVRASYFFRDEGAYSSFAKRIPRCRDVLTRTRMAVEFSGLAEDMPLALLSPPAPFDPTHAVSLKLSTTGDYRVVRMRGGAFYKFCSTREEAVREAAIHKFLHDNHADHIVPFDSLKETPRVFDLFPNVRVDGAELPLCILTRAPGEPYELMAQTADLALAAERVGALARLLNRLYAVHGFVHGDVHGANVIFTASGKPVLLDFGMSEIHDRALAAKIASRVGGDVSENSFDDEDIFLHLLNSALPIYDTKMDRGEFLHLYDLGRAVMKSVPEFEDELAHRFIPGYDRDDPRLAEIREPMFKNHFVCAFRMINARYNNMASDRLARLRAR